MARLPASWRFSLSASPIPENPLPTLSAGVRITELFGVGLMQALLVPEAQAVVGANRKHIRLCAPLQHAPQPRVRTIDPIAQHPGAGRARIERSGDQLAGDLRLGGK